MDSTSTLVTAPDDTIKQLQTWALRISTAVALLGVVGAPAAASWHGLTRFGLRELGLSGGWQYLVPLSLDGAALLSALLGLRAVLAGDSGIGARTLMWVYVLGAAGFNAHAAPSDPAALFYAGASVSVVVLVDAVLRELRRDRLRALGVVQGASARFRPLRWLLAPSETGQAWRGAVLDDVTDPRVALAMVRGDVTTPHRPDVSSDGASGESATSEVVGHSPLTLIAGPTKADALRAVFDEIGFRDVPQALKILKSRGLAVDRSYAYTVAWAAKLRAVSGGDRR